MCCRCEYQASEICCCGTSLKKGVKILACILLVCTGISIIHSILEFIRVNAVLNAGSSSQPENMGFMMLSNKFSKQKDVAESFQSIILIATVISLIIDAVGIIMHVLLLLGASQAHCCKLRAWRVYAIIILVLECLGGLIVLPSVLSAVSSSTFASIVWIVLTIYGLVLVNSLIAHIRDHPDEYGQPGNMQYGQPGNMQYGQPGNMQYGQPENMQYGQPGNMQYGQPGNMQYGQPGNMQPGYMQNGQPGNMQPGYMQNGQPGNMQTGYDMPPGNMPPGNDMPPGNMQPQSTNMDP